MHRRQLLWAGMAAALGPAAAQQPVLPSRPIRILLGFPPGGSTDGPMRVLAEDAARLLGQPVIIENRPGNAGLMPAQLLQSAPADGSTLGVIPGNLFRFPYTGNISWDPARDLRYVIGLTEFVYGIVVPADSPLRSLDDLIRFARANPERLSYATAGPWLSQHITMEQIARIQNVRFNHVPYKGSAEALNAVLGGHVMAAADTSAWGPYVASGKLRLLVTFNARRVARFADVPTLREVGIDFPPPSAAWGLAAPKHTPDAVVHALHEIFHQAMQKPGFRDALATYDMQPVHMSAEQYQRFAAESVQREKRLLEEIGFVKS